MTTSNERGRPPVIAAIDFDGVANALPRRDADLEHWDRWQRRQVMGYTLTVAGEVIDWLTTLPSRGAEFHWATTWAPNRHLLGEEFGLPADAPVVADPDRRDEGELLHVGTRQGGPALNWKATQVLDTLERQRRCLLWLDDDAITDGAVEALDELANRVGISVMTIETAPFTGLRPDELALADEFLERVGQGTATVGVSVHRARP